MTDHRFDHRQLDARLDTLTETVRDLAILVEETTRWAAVHAVNTGHEGTARVYASVNGRIRELVASVTPECEPSDAFGDPA